MVRFMTGVEYAAWGLFGGFAVEGLEFAGAIRRTGGWPWRQRGEPGPLALGISVLIRLAIGAGLAVAAGTTGQVSGPFGALAVGIAAPLVVEQLARQVPLQTAPTPGVDQVATKPPPSGQAVHLGKTAKPHPEPMASTDSGASDAR